MLQGGISYNDILKNGSSMGGGSNSGQSMGSGGMVQGGEAPGIWGQIKKEVDSRKAGIANALADNANRENEIFQGWANYRANFNPQNMQINSVQPIQASVAQDSGLNPYKYLVG